MMDKGHETVQGAISYVVGGGAIGFGLSDLAQYAQDWAIIIGFLIVLLRLAHDLVRFIRLLNDK